MLETTLRVYPQKENLDHLALLDDQDIVDRCPPILVYHNIVDKDHPHISPGCSVMLDDFKSQMETLHQKGFECVSLFEMLQPSIKSLPKKRFALTFDDGSEDFYFLVAPYLREMNFPATVFIVVDRVGLTSNWEANVHIPLMNWSQIQELQQEEFTFGSHTCTHSRLLFLTKEQVEHELAHSKDMLEERLQVSVPIVAYPCGESNVYIQHQALKAGYQAGLGTISGFQNRYNIWRWPGRSKDTPKTICRKASATYQRYIRSKIWFLEGTSVGQAVRKGRNPWLKELPNWELEDRELDFEVITKTESTEPLVSVLIITWNRKEDVLETIQSVYNQAYSNFEVILVDNGSEDDTVEAVNTYFPDVKVIAHRQNKGISARNDGVEIASGEIIFCLDSDASLGAYSLQHVVRKFREAPNVGVLNSKIVNADTMKIDPHTGWSYSEEAKEQQDTAFTTFSFSEGGAAIRKSIFDLVGGFWERLFFGCEGFEFSLRVMDAGYEICYFPDSIIYHRTSEKARIHSGARDTMFLNNFLTIYLARFPLWLMVLFLPGKVAATLLRGIKRGYFKDVLKNLWEFAKLVPAILKERDPICRSAAMKFYKLQRDHGSLSWGLRSWWKNKS